MADLKKPLPESCIGEFLFFLVQLIRAILNLLYIGVFIERAMMRFLGRQETALLETKAYMYGAKLHALSNSAAKPFSASRFFGCVLAAASNLNACGAPIGMSVFALI